MRRLSNTEVRTRARLRTRTKIISGVKMTSFSLAELRRALHDKTVEQTIRQKLYAWMLSRQKRLPRMPHRRGPTRQEEEYARSLGKRVTALSKKERRAAMTTVIAGVVEFQLRVRR